MQWPAHGKPDVSVADGDLHLQSPENNFVYLLGQKIFTKDYQGIVEVDLKNSDAASGIAMIGEGEKYLAVAVKENVIEIIKVDRGENEIITWHSLEKAGNKIFIKA